MVKTNSLMAYKIAGLYRSSKDLWSLDSIGAKTSLAVAVRVFSHIRWNSRRTQVMTIRLGFPQASTTGFLGNEFGHTRTLQYSVLTVLDKLHCL